MRISTFAVLAICFGSAAAIADPDCGGDTACTGRSHTHAVDGIPFAWAYNCDGGDCQHGRFLDGTVWVRNPRGGNVTIDSVTPDDAVSGLEKNPGTGTKATSFTQGLFAKPGSDSTYVATLDLSTQLPYQAPADDGVYVKAKAYTGGDCDLGAVGSDCLDSYDAITVVKNLPNDGALGRKTFRPGMAGATKQWITTADIDLSRLPAISAITPGTSSDYTAIQKLWGSPTVVYFNGKNGDHGQRWSPKARSGMQAYSNYRSAGNVTDMYRLFGTDGLTSAKTQAAYAMLQYAIDIYAGYLQGVEWVNGAGQGQGYWHPIVFLGALSKDATLQQNVRNATAKAATNGDGSNVQFTELHQVRRGVHGKAIWGGYPGADSDGCAGGSYSGLGRYWSNYAGHVLRNERNKATCGDPYGYIDGPAEIPGDYSYINLTSGVYISIALVMKIWPEFDDIANNPVFKEYAERVMDGAGWWTAEDQVAKLDPREPTACNPYTATTVESSGCLYWGVTWGVKNGSTNSPVTVAEARAAGHPSPGPRWPNKHLQGRPTNLTWTKPGSDYWDNLAGTVTAFAKPKAPIITVQ